jgi:hypothetical protein
MARGSEQHSLYPETDGRPDAIQLPSQFVRQRWIDGRAAANEWYWLTGARWRSNIAPPMERLVSLFIPD